MRHRFRGLAAALAAVAISPAGLGLSACGSEVCNVDRVRTAYDEAIAKQTEVVGAIEAGTTARLTAERELIVLRAQKEVAIATCKDANT